MASAKSEWARAQYLMRFCNGQHGAAVIKWTKFSNSLVKMRPQGAHGTRAAVKTLQEQVEALEAWIYRQYVENGFDAKGAFKGWPFLIGLLTSRQPMQTEEITAAVSRLRMPGNKYSFGDPAKISLVRATQRNQQQAVQLQQQQQRPAQKKPAVAPQKQPQHQPIAERTRSKEQQIQTTPDVFVSMGNSKMESDIDDLWQTLHSEKKESQIDDLWEKLHGDPQQQTPKQGSEFLQDPALKTAPSFTTHSRYSLPTALLGNPTAPSNFTKALPSSLTVDLDAGFLPHPNSAPAKTESGTATALSAKSANAKLSKPNGAVQATSHDAKRIMENILAKKMNQMTLSTGIHTASYASSTTTSSSGSSNDRHSELDLKNFLHPNPSKRNSVKDQSSTEISHSPLIAGDVLDKNNDVLRQYGFLGSYVDSGNEVYQNTNVPFASFICGVQGSGKSHTTSCMLENALIPVCSRDFGRLEKPLSAMVFSYDKFNSDGTGFNISEAASLASPNPQLPNHLRARKVTVLVSPSNPVIREIYSRLPNVTVIPFKLDPRTLTVNTILTLMAVDEASAVPLYLAQLTKILREMNVEFNGRFDYAAFKYKLKQCKFNPQQRNMLQLRLDLLESFLDLRGNAQQPTFEPGEITIMDMSCPFVDANTACILFNIGLDRYLESKVAGKMVVLDEAHKYMLNVPGAKALNQELINTIRLQRHKGVRTIIATQEPTLLTDLIALCDVAVIHRFSSPEWFAALKKHIPMSNHDQNVLLDDIESLKPGTALVYSPKAILGYDENQELVKGTGKFMKVKVRNRITSDGGRSVLAV